MIVALICVILFSAILAVLLIMQWRRKRKKVARVFHITRPDFDQTIYSIHNGSLNNISGTVFRSYENLESLTMLEVGNKLVMVLPKGFHLHDQVKESVHNEVPFGVELEIRIGNYE